jgi:ribosomal-protein-alanine N-acetyltransferase
MVHVYNLCHDMVETTRLQIRPLNKEDLHLYLQGKDQFEACYGLTQTGRKVAPAVRHMAEKFTLPKMAASTADNYLFFTFWVVIDKAHQLVVAELGFKGEPNHRREIEIGYGTMPTQQSKGYMTEAVGGMLRWAAARSDVQTMLAETDEVNLASIRVLRNNKFIQFDRKDNMLWWKYNCKTGI